MLMKNCLALDIPSTLKEILVLSQMADSVVEKQHVTQNVSTANIQAKFSENCHTGRC